MDKNHILIVEDDADIRSGIEIYLKNQGYDVSQAGDGIEGLAVIEKEEIDLAIVDIMMPRMDGITMMMKVREKGYDFPVIMLSAKSEEVEILDLEGMDKYIKVIPAASLSCSTNDEALAEFLEYLDSDEAAAVWTKYGYEKA